MAVVMCERPQCGIYFDNADHRQQRFCSKRCGKLGTQLRHKGMIDNLEENALELALLLVASGCSFGVAAEKSGVKKSTVYNHYQKKRLLLGLKT